MLTHEAARGWLDRWDRQQEGYLPDREERFTALIDAVEALGRPDPLVLDLGCGPGSLSVRLLERLPRASVVSIDADPLLLALGRAAYPQLTFADLDLREPGWAEGLGLERPADAAVSTTALHWIPKSGLPALYKQVHDVLRPGGLLLNGDHLQTEDVTPTLARLERVLHDRETERMFTAGRPEDWRSWWEAVDADPDLAPYRKQRSDDHTGEESLLLSSHALALREAGFAEVGTLWQHGHKRLLCAVKEGSGRTETSVS
ncbi:class I SAM-dependent methyltransferase [Nonomuraea longicatena]|uniref:Class I SAM-dependent methyltransferase n=1 Tax=Nonomuraea longicatena TaxID=83682 RepID=A0ABP4A751_9ACTN